MHYIPLSCTSSPCNLLFLNQGIYGLVQATVGVGTVLIWDFCVAYTRGGGVLPLSPNDHPTIAQGSRGFVRGHPTRACFQPDHAGVKARKSSTVGPHSPHGNVRLQPRMLSVHAAVCWRALPLCPWQCREWISWISVSKAREGDTTEWHNRVTQ